MGTEFDLIGDTDLLNTDLRMHHLGARHIILNSDIDELSAEHVINQLLFLSQQGDEDITVRINSSGGSVVDGLAIIDVMQAIKPEISTICTGVAYSMAAILLASGKKGKRRMLKNSEVMIHEVSSEVSGRAIDLITQTNLLRKSNNTLIHIMSEFTGQSIRKIRRDMSRDYFMTSEEALRYGVVDEIVRSL